MTNETSSTNWGGSRPGAGRPPTDTPRLKDSIVCAPGTKELAQKIAKVKGLRGWGHVVDLAIARMIEGDVELRQKLEETE